MKIQWRKLKQEIKNHASSYVVAVSGGVDSIFLLDFIARCDVRIHIAHVNHGLREQSTEEARFVSSLTEKMNLPFSYLELYGLKKTNTEAEARKHRYTFFKQLQKDYNIEKVITAHHLNDQVETIMLRLMRGISHDNLGMKKDNGFVYRPFLEIPKEEIIKQAQKRNLTWFEDETNHESNYERNWIRNELMPEMLKRRNILKTIPNGLLDE